MPGITSQASKASQSGLLQLPTTDEGGNLASDGGATFNAIASVQAGAAIALALATPQLAAGERFGVRVGWGGFDAYQDSANAVGINAIGVIGRDLFFKNDRLSFEGGVGLGQSAFMHYDQNSVVGGRAGMQLTW